MPNHVSRDGQRRSEVDTLVSALLGGLIIWGGVTGILLIITGICAVADFLAGRKMDFGAVMRSSFIIPVIVVVAFAKTVFDVIADGTGYIYENLLELQLWLEDRL